MKTSNYISAFLFLCGATIGILIYREFRKAGKSNLNQLTLEQVLSIRELHLVKHTYTDLFFLHKRNDPHKPIRAIVQVPVTITAYLNLNDIELVWQGDSIRQVILPSAVLDKPVYHTDNMIVRETRAFQLHAGKDLYPQVATYLGSQIALRIDTVRYQAEASRILIRAETEAKEYLDGILHVLGHTGVEVIFKDAARNATAAAYQQAHKKVIPAPARTKAKAEMVHADFPTLTLN